MGDSLGKNIAQFRKDQGWTQEDLALKLHVSAQAVSKWENGHSLPETALLPEMARLLDVSMDELFRSGGLNILEAFFGDGLSMVNVTKRMNRLIENQKLAIPAVASLLGVEGTGERVRFLIITYQGQEGDCHAVYKEGEDICLSWEDKKTLLPGRELAIIAGSYGTAAHHCDVMGRIEHLRGFGGDSFRADHHTFPSDPANDGVEYLTLVYLNEDGIHMATCAEGDSLVYENDRKNLVGCAGKNEFFIPNVPKLLSFGQGQECSWADSLTVALKAMGTDTDYVQVMGVSGACYRLAFCSPLWDYSAVDGLVAYDYATPGFAAYGYTPQMYGHIEKQDRAMHKERIAKEMRSHMPVLGINLRVAHEWGIITGYKDGGEELYCRTKYDEETIRNDPEFMQGHPQFQKEWLGPYEYMKVDNWPFLLCYFTEKRQPPTAKENLLASLSIFLDCAAKTAEGGYYMGFKAYEVWIDDVLGEEFYQGCTDEQFARRFSVNQFCMLALHDARKAAYAYLLRSVPLLADGVLQAVIDSFGEIAIKAEEIHHMLDSGEMLSGERCRQFWTIEMRKRQAALLTDMLVCERRAYDLVGEILSK